MAASLSSRSFTRKRRFSCSDRSTSYRLECSGMSLEQPIIAIIGAGAVGAYYGGRLARRGFNVHFLLRSDYEVVRQRGWTIHSCQGDFVLPPSEIHVYNDPRQMPKTDFVIVTLKA